MSRQSPPTPLSAAGIALGGVAALLLTRAMTSMLVDVRPTDPLTFGTMGVVFFVIAGVSSWLPARRAGSRPYGGAPRRMT